MTVYDFATSKGFRIRVKSFGYRHAFKLIGLAVWSVLFWLGEVLLRVVF